MFARQCRHRWAQIGPDEHQFVRRRRRAGRGRPALQRDERLQHRHPVLARQVQADVDQVAVLHRKTEARDQALRLLRRHRREIGVEAVQHGRDLALFRQAQLQQVAPGQVRDAGDQVGARQPADDQPLEQPAAAADVPARHHAQGRLDRDHVVAGDEVGLAQHPRYVHGVGVVADVHHVGPAQRGRERGQKQDELVDIAEPLPPARGGGHAKHHARGCQHAHLAALARQFSFQNLLEGPHAVLAVRLVVRDEKHLQCRGSLLAGLRGFFAHVFWVGRPGSAFGRHYGGRRCGPDCSMRGPAHPATTLRRLYAHQNCDGQARRYARRSR